MSGIHRFLTRRDRHGRGRQSKEEVGINATFHAVVFAETPWCSTTTNSLALADAAHIKKPHVLPVPHFRGFFTTTDTPSNAQENNSEHEKKVLLHIQFGLSGPR